MANSILDLITGGEASQATDQMNQALAAIAAVPNITPQEMEYQVQQLVQQGTITPDLATTFLQDPSAFAQENISQTGTQAQTSEIEQLLSDAAAGGLSPEEQQQTESIIQALNTQEKGQQGAILQDAAARGTLTGGETIAAEEEANQGDQASANQEGLASAANAQALQLQELQGAGSAGAGLQTQENTQANTVAAATDAINQFNAAQQEQTNEFNVNTQNEAQAANLAEKQAIADANAEANNQYAAYQAQLPQETEQDALQKAAAQAGVSETGANLSQEQGGQMAGLIGGTIGAAGDVGASAFAPVPTTTINTGAPVSAAHGGMIHDYRRGGSVVADDPFEVARYPGDDPRNDTVPADLSEDEIVLPRTETAHPDPEHLMSFVRRAKAQATPAKAHPDDVGSVLEALHNRRYASV